MRKIRLITCTLLLLVVAKLNAVNNTWSWGENETEAKGVWMKMEGLVKQKKYSEATPLVTWLLVNTPNLNVALYINAIKVYENREKKASNADEKKVLQDSTLLLYDKRIELFGSEKKVLNRKGRVAWKYLANRENESANLYALYSKIYTLNKSRTKDVNLYNWVQSAGVEYSKKVIQKEELFDVFAKCNEVFDQQLLTAKKVERLEKYKALTIMAFAAKADLSCELIQAEFGRTFKTDPNVNKAKMIISLCVAQKCFSDSSFVDAAQFLSKENQSNYSLEVTLAKAYLKRSELDSALSTFDRAISLSVDTIKKATLLLDKAKVKSKQGKNGESRSLALEALKLNPSLSEAHGHIGDLYFNSANQCENGNKVENRSVYIAAAAQYKKAGWNAKANEMKAQFPSVEELFLYNLKAGDTFSTKCWMNVQVVLQTR